MQASYFETGRYYAPSNLPRQWPMPAGIYDREAGLRAFRGMVERSRYVEELGFDWVSVSDPDRLVLLELWKDQAALDAHAKLQAQRPSLPEGLRLGAGEREDYTYNRTR